jgi:DNA-binding MarR family transcriptional regulator
MKIEKAINQKAFKNPHQKAHINVLYTASWLSQQNAKVLKPFQISWQQFNILRILRGMAPQPATVKLLTERMIDKTSNASRLVEKLKRKDSWSE